ncbi:MAG: TauD/TfdA family dioxygenase [Acidobacteriota bacterium]
MTALQDVDFAIADPGTLAERAARGGCRLDLETHPVVTEDGGGLPGLLELLGQPGLLDGLLRPSGAVLLRGFPLDSIPQFERVAGSALREVFTENGEHQKLDASSQVQTPVEFAADQQLLWHNENTFNRFFPTKILFGAARPAAEGGETPIVDGRRIYERMDPEMRARFEEHGVMYVRNFSPGLGLDWREVFRVSTRDELEQRCLEQGVDFEWLDGGERLRTRSVRPAIGPHPATGEPCFFAQPQHFHPSCLDAETRESMGLLFAEEDFPRHCFFGDGTPLGDDLIEDLVSLYFELETAFPWQKGDVLVVDNVAAAHGRNPYRGERKLLVAMGDLIAYEVDGTFQLAS